MAPKRYASRGPREPGSDRVTRDWGQGLESLAGADDGLDAESRMASGKMPQPRLDNSSRSHESTFILRMDFVHLSQERTRNTTVSTNRALGVEDLPGKASAARP